MSGHPKWATLSEKVDAIHKMVINDRRSTVRHIAETVGLSTGSVHTILSEDLGHKKVLWKVESRSGASPGQCITPQHCDHSNQMRLSAAFPDLALSDCYLFPKLKEDLCGKSFNDDNEVIVAVAHTGQRLLQDGHSQAEAALDQQH
ncbi:unnamed protein product [Caretta caretta]